MSEEERESEEKRRSAEVQKAGMKVRPNNWLVPVILLSLR